MIKYVMIGVFINMLTIPTSKKKYGWVHVKYLKLPTRLLNLEEFIFSPPSFFGVLTPHSTRVFIFFTILHLELLENLLCKLFLVYKDFIISLFDRNPLVVCHKTNIRHLKLFDHCLFEVSKHLWIISYKD